MTVSLPALLMVAQAAGTQSGGPASFLVTFGPLILIFVIMYFLLWRPQQKKAQEHEQMINDIKAGDRVISAGGMHGTVTGVREKTFMVEVADRVVIELSRPSVAAVLDKDAKADKGDKVDKVDKADKGDKAARYEKKDGASRK